MPRMQNQEAILSSVNNLHTIFSIVLALALAEAFKQFVSDSPTEPQGQTPIHWDRLMALVAFLLLLIPFYHGMGRYFYDVYHSKSIPHPYPLHLIVDSLAFLIEGSLFFVMSRALARTMWRRFYWAVVMILAVDTVWAFFVWWTHRPEIVEWLIMNCIFLPVFAAILGWCRGRIAKWGPVVALVAMLIRTVGDYATSWDFYFPEQQGSTISESSTALAPVTKPNASVYIAGPLFTQSEWQWNESLASHLREMGFEIVLPQERAVPMLQSKESFSGRALFTDNIAAIDRAQLVVAVLDGADADSGTSWECGYAFKAGRPIIGLRTDLRAGGDDSQAGMNLMLSNSCSQIVAVPQSKQSDIVWLTERVAGAIRQAQKKAP
jgi:nucleoside 2-deoxyribosyltransferase